MKNQVRRLLFSILLLLGLLAGLRVLAVPYATSLVSGALTQAGYKNITTQAGGVFSLDITVRQAGLTLPVLQLTANPLRLLVDYVLSRPLVLAEVSASCPASEATTDITALLGHRLVPSLAGVPDVEVTKLVFTCPAQEFSLTGYARLLHGQLTGGGQGLLGAAQLEIKSVVLTDAPYQLQGQAQILSAGLVGAVSFFHTLAAEDKGVLSAELTLGGLVLGSQPLGISVKLNPAQQSGPVLPVTAEISSREQSLKAAGDIDLLRQTANFKLEGGFAADAIEAIGVKGELATRSFWPLGINAKNITVTALQLGGLPLTTLRSAASLTGSTLKLDKTTALLFGGQIEVAPVSLKLPPGKVTADVAFDQLDLSQIIQLGAVDGLAGAGRISGMVPVTYDHGKISLGMSELKAVSTGTITYAPAEMPGFMAPGEQGALLAEIFRDFHYDGLTLKLGGTLGDNLTLGVRLAGSNPTFYNGHPVVFNLNLSGALESLLTKGLETFRFTPQSLGELVREGEQK